MALGTRQTNLFAAEDWKQLYTTFSQADFQSYDFETIRKVMVDYIKTYYAEDFNDFTESSEYIALLDIIAFTAQSLAFRTDLNARENFLETAERRESVLKLIKQLSYSPNRNRSASGLLKVTSVSTTERLVANSGKALDRVTVNWNDPGNLDWLQQFVQIMNAAFDSSQRFGKPYASKTISDILTEQYNIAIPNATVPVVAFNTVVVEASTPFEVVSASILEGNSVGENNPGSRGRLGMLYQQDGKGFSGSNTGFFMYFKQGQLQSLDFTISDKLPNRKVSIPVDNINNEDVWVFELNNGTIGNEWTKVQSSIGSNTTYNSVARGIRTLYSVETNLNDQITLNFGDGTFSDMPQGTYRAYFRVSNGITYRLSPADLSNVGITIPYISREGRAETLSLTASLQHTVSNSSRRDLLDEIKQKAPQNYYTQNRMVNGEDYNIFPYARYSDIVKVKSVNRFSSGISRNLDLIDPTGRYSATNLLSDDGAIFKEEFTKNLTFTFNTRNEATSAIRNLVLPLLTANSMKQFYYEKYPIINIGSTTYTEWQKITDDTTTCTGFFLNSAGDKQQLGEYTSSLRRYLLRGGLIRFEAPAGQYFDTNNVLTAGTPALATEKTYIWASIRNMTGNGTNDVYFAGRQIGAITLSENIPSGAIITHCYVPFATQFSISLIVTMTNLIYNNIDFGLRFDYTVSPLQTIDPWKVISISNLNESAEFDLTNTGSTTSSAEDASWLIKFKTDGTRYTVTYRGMDYVYASKDKVRFLNTNTTRTYDSKTNTFVKDNVKILNINTKPDSTDKMSKDVVFEIYDNVTESDGYVDTSKILVTYSDSNDDGIIDDPSTFSQVSSATIKNIFFKKYFDFDNLVRYQLQEAGTINTIYATKSAIELYRNNYPVGKVFYASTDDKFYEIKSINSVKSVVETTEYSGYAGRQGLYFQYVHNASESKRIDPSSSNLIDMYILTRSYDEAYRTYISDTTSTVSEPNPPTSFELQNDYYKDLFDYKMLTDALLMSSGIYKPIFGAKSKVSLQATIQVIKGRSTTISDNELKSMVVNTINDYFALANWNFGDTFYFSELSAYLHKQLSGELGSVILIPKDSNAVFGSLYEIRCQPNEIFISAATVDDIEVVSGVLSGINASGINTTQVFKGVTY